MAGYFDLGADLSFGLFIVHFAAFFRAVFNAIATACFWGLPAFISVRILLDIAFFEHPWVRGMIILLGSFTHYIMEKAEKYRNVFRPFFLRSYRLRPHPKIRTNNFPALYCRWKNAWYKVRPQKRH